MAVIKQSENNSGNYYQSCLKSDVLKAITPKADTLTVFRPYPQLTEDGGVLPMVMGMTKDGPDFSAVHIDTTVVNTGIHAKWSGLTTPKPVKPGERPYKAFDRPFEGSYIRLKSQLDKGRLSAEQRQVVAPLFTKEKGQNAAVANQPMSQPRDTLLMQGACTMLRGDDLSANPMMNAVLFCTGSLFTAMAKCLAEAHAQGIDVFSPDAGYVLHIESLPPDRSVGRQTSIYTVTLGEQTPVDLDTIKQVVQPWEEVLDYLTYDEQINKLIECFGVDPIAVAFPNDVARITGQSAAPTPAAPPAPARVVAARPTAPGLGATATLGAKPAAPPVLGAKPALGGKPVLGAKVPSAQTQQVVAPTANEQELEAAYAALMKSQETQ